MDGFPFFTCNLDEITIIIRLIIKVRVNKMRRVTDQISVGQENFSIAHIRNVVHPKIIRYIYDKVAFSLKVFFSIFFIKHHFLKDNIAKIIRAIITTIEAVIHTDIQLGVLNSVVVIEKVNKIPKNNDFIKNIMVKKSHNQDNPINFFDFPIILLSPPFSQSVIVSI